MNVKTKNTRLFIMPTLKRGKREGGNEKRGATIKDYNSTIRIPDAFYRYSTISSLFSLLCESPNFEILYLLNSALDRPMSYVLNMAKGNVRIHSTLLWS